jgi:hypothetical protein
LRWVAILKSCLHNFHPHDMQQWNTELGKSNGWECWADADDAGVKIKGAGALQRVAIWKSFCTIFTHTTCSSGVQNLVNLMGGNLGLPLTMVWSGSKALGHRSGWIYQRVVCTIFTHMTCSSGAKNLVNLMGRNVGCHQRWWGQNQMGQGIVVGAISKSHLQILHPYYVQQWSAELGKSNGRELWAATDDGVVMIKGARALRWVAILMNKAREHLWTTLVQDLPAMCRQPSNQQVGGYDHRDDASKWDGMNSAPISGQKRESTAYDGVLLDTDGSMKWHRRKKRA